MCFLLILYKLQGSQESLRLEKRDTQQNIPTVYKEDLLRVVDTQLEHYLMNILLVKHTHL